MTLKHLLLIMICGTPMLSILTSAHDGHDHSNNAESKNNEHSHKHTDKSTDKKEDKHGHKDGEHSEHGEEMEHSDSGGEEKHTGHDHGSEDAHADEKSASVGPGLAILEAHETRGIRLNEKAVKRLKLEFSRVDATPKGFEVPNGSIIGQRGETLIYVQRNDWLTMVKVDVISRSKDRAFIKSENLKNDEKVVSSNAGLVRLSHLEAFGASGDGHGH